MARRTLVEGMRPPALTREQAFMRGEEYVPPQPSPSIAPEAPENLGHAPFSAPPMGRSSITTRIRTDYANALKKASLERQLDGRDLNTIVDILEAALGQWLLTNGHLPKSS